MAKLTRQKVLENTLERMERADIAKKYQEDKKKYESTPEHLEFVKRRKLLQESTRIKKNENEENLRSLEIFNIIRSFEDLNDGKVDEYEIYTKVLDKFSKELSFLEKQAPTITYPSYMTALDQTFYTDLWDKLVKRLPIFLLGAPKFTFNVSGLPFNKLSNENRLRLQTHLEEYDLFKSSKFTSYYGKYFPDHVESLNIDLSNLSQLYGCLRLDYTCFNRLSKYDKEQLYTGKTLIETFKVAPRICIYLPRAQQTKIKKEGSSSFVKYLVANPDVLDSLPTDFFDENEMKYTFSCMSKARLLEAFGDRAKRFPAFVKYLNIKVDTDTTDNDNTLDTNL